MVSTADMVAGLYDTLRDIASRQLRRERGGHTLQTTALVHEAYLRLARGPGDAWPSREAFCAAAAATIRRVLVDHARARNCAKRGGPHAKRVTLDTDRLLAPERPVDLCELDDALAELQAIDERRVRVVELRFFCGLTEPEAAAALGVSERTVRTKWRSARLWLRRRLEVSRQA